MVLNGTRIDAWKYLFTNSYQNRNKGFCLKRLKFYRIFLFESFNLSPSYYKCCNLPFCTSVWLKFGASIKENERTDKCVFLSCFKCPSLVTCVTLDMAWNWLRQHKEVGKHGKGENMHSDSFQELKRRRLSLVSMPK